MSIQSEITRIAGNVANAYSALSAKGATLPDLQNSENLASAIESVQGGEAMSIETIWEICGYVPKVGILPNGYTLLDYIESTGTQYIDTGFKPNQNTKMCIDLVFAGTVGTNITGIRNSSADTVNRFGLITFGSASKIGAFFRDSAIQAIPFDNGRHEYELSRSGLFVDGTQYGSANSGTFACNYPLVLFGWSDGSEGVSATASRIYSCQVYDNGTLVRQYAPCIDTNGAVGLYDTVEGKFYGNAGTGTFVAGNDLVECEYIESSGTQYIDTGFFPNQDTRVVAITQWNNVPTTDECIFGERNSNTEQFWCYWRNAASAFSFRYADKSTNNLVAATPTNKNILDANKNVLSIGDSSVTATAGTFAAVYPIFIFAVNNAGTSQYPASAKLYSCQIYDNNALVRDYIPMVAGNEYGLYDKVNNRFYTNAGSGSFSGK